MINFKKLSKIAFPTSRNININMMPIMMGNHSTIPSEYAHYHPIIRQCENALANKDFERGKIWYLSIMESIVPPYTSQRRAGIHVEKMSASHGWGGGWGGGSGHDQNLYSGLFMASSTDYSCRVWDTRAADPQKVSYQSVESADGHVMKRNELYWLTDACPHEAMINETSKHIYRQWFRLVSSDVGIWYTRHSTPNRLNVVPDKYKTRIVDYSKFV
jgi:hypothetical protein